MMTFFSPRSGWPGGSGSGSVTSKAAALIVFSRNACTRASVYITPPGGGIGGFITTV